MNHVIMVASENDALKNAKVGGVGDVVRDLPHALAMLGWQVTTIIPSYGFLHNVNPSKQQTRITFPFEGRLTEGEIWDVTPKQARAGVRHLVLHHPSIGGEPIYYNDPPALAFARDATKYALFCSAVGQYLRTEAQPYVLHLHDWHTGCMLLLRELHQDFRHLKSVRTVFTIHNLAIQGNRPMKGKQAAVEQWFPELFVNADGWMDKWKDPRYKDPVFTPMAAGIRYSDRVNTVSPTYAAEILLPSDTANGLYRGEGLEKDLGQCKREGRLFGILNGAEYPNDRVPPLMKFPDLCDLTVQEVSIWNQKQPDVLHEEAIDRIRQWRNKTPRILLTSVTRVTDQKVRIFFEKGKNGRTAIDGILELLDKHGGLYLFLGAGTADYEQKLIDSFRKHAALVFLRGYSDPLARALYANGTLFMMPSSFEPCGIGQMIAMRDGQPCVVNAVGGLKDTVIDGVNGFVFSGPSLPDQVDGFVSATDRALRMYSGNSVSWQKIREAARSARFTWEASAKKYEELMYR